MNGPLTGAVLAGGDSRRMGRDKATLPWGKGTLLERVLQSVSPLCDELLVVTREDRRKDLAAETPDGCRVVTDVSPGRGPLVGIHAALTAARHDRVLVVACDMPRLSRSLLRAMRDEGVADVVIPRTGGGWEPLHAIYRRACLPAIECALAGGGAPVASFFAAVDVEVWDQERCRRHDPDGSSFADVNDPSALSRAARIRPGSPGPRRSS